MTPAEWKNFRAALLNSGHSLEEIADEFGTPLLLFFEEEIKDEAKMLNEWARSISSLSKPVRRLGARPALGAKAFEAGRLAEGLPVLLSSLGAFPRKAVLALLQSNSMGFVLGNRNEILRCKNAGIDLKQCIYSTPFKSPTEALEAMLEGVGILSIESFTEFQELRVFERQLAGRSARKPQFQPISLCYTFQGFTAASHSSSKPHFASEEFLEIARACAASHNFKLRGASLAYHCEEDHSNDLEDFKTHLQFLSQVALERQALNLDSIFLLIRLKFPQASSRAAKIQELARLKHIIGEILSEGNRTVPLELKIQLAEGLCGYSSHILTQVLKVKYETPQCDSVYLDLNIGRRDLALGSKTFADQPRTLLSNSCPAYHIKAASTHEVQKKHLLFARNPLYNEPVLFGEFYSNETFRSGDLVFIPRTCAKETIELLGGLTGFQPAELLLGLDGSTRVVRTRAPLSSELATEV